LEQTIKEKSFSCSKNLFRSRYIKEKDVKSIRVFLFKKETSTQFLKLKREKGWGTEIKNISLS
jgi:hypothetical protein